MVGPKPVDSRLMSYTGYFSEEKQRCNGMNSVFHDTWFPLVSWNAELLPRQPRASENISSKLRHGEKE